MYMNNPNHHLYSNFQSNYLSWPPLYEMLVVPKYYFKYCFIMEFGDAIITCSIHHKDMNIILIISLMLPLNAETPQSNKLYKHY